MTFSEIRSLIWKTLAEILGITEPTAALTGASATTFLRGDGTWSGLGTAATVSTTDATVTTLATIAIPSSTTVVIEAVVRARRTGGTAGTAEDAAGYSIVTCYKNVAGTATEVGETAVFTAEDQAGWACTFSASSSNALLRVTGAVDNNIDWAVTYRTYTVT